MLRFCQELAARVDRAGAHGEKLLRADSGFWNTTVFAYLEKIGWQYSIGVRNIKKVQVAVHAIDETAWQHITYPAGGEAQIAETVYGDRRLIVRRTRLVRAQAELFPDWRHFCLITNRTQSITIVEAEHRDHAVVERSSPTSKTRPSRTFPPATTTPTPRGPSSPRSRTTSCAGHSCSGYPTAPFARPAPCAAASSTFPALNHHARGWTLHLPARWPWHQDYTRALTRIRALPAA